MRIRLVSTTKHYPKKGFVREFFSRLRVMRLEEIPKQALIRIVDDDIDLLEATELMLTYAG